MLKKGVINRIRIVFLVALLSVVLLFGSKLILSEEDRGIDLIGTRYINYNTLNANLSADVTLNGSATTDGFGWASAIGDFNGDGLNDLAVGAYQADTKARLDTGVVYVFLGPLNSGTFDANRSANFTINGTGGATTSDLFGYALTSGDFNGDRISDLAVGAYQADPAVAGGQNEGMVNVFLGGTWWNGVGKTIDARPAANFTVNGSAKNDNLGDSIGAGDFNGDSISDLVVGAKSADPAVGGSAAGKAYVFFGGSWWNAPGNNFDANTSANLTFNGSAAGNNFGSSFISGDFNADNVQDLVVGADSGGKAYVFFGGGWWNGSGRTFDSNSNANVTFSGTSMGQAFAGGDFNGDRIIDLAIGADLASPAVAGSEAGLVHVFYGGSWWNGSLSASSANVTFNGSASTDQFGLALASGDLNGDGLKDLIISAPGADPAIGGTNAGKAYVFFAGSGWNVFGKTFDANTSANITFNGSASGLVGDAFGISVYSADLNADSSADIIVGSRSASPDIGGYAAGKTYVFFANTSSIPAPVNVASLNWANFDFTGLPYASGGEGSFGKYADCSGGACSTLFDLKSIWVSQDSNFLAWKVTGKNFSQATFCQGTGDLNLELEFDADGNVSTGCVQNSSRSDPCYPGADYQILVNKTGNGSVYTFNSSGLVNSCPSGNCFKLTSNITVFVNVSKNSSGVCDAEPSSVRIAVNKSQLKWSVLTFGVGSKTSSGGPRDHLGAETNDFESVGFGGGDFFEEGGNFSMMFRGDGCGAFTNQSYCTNGALNGNFSCVWESDFSHCRPNFEDAGNFACADFCGSCTSQSDCNSGARGTCKWIGDSGPCIEDFDKFRFGGNCDSSCKDCFNQNACSSSRSSGGCSWTTDPMIGRSFCSEAGTSFKTCGPNSETTQCNSCNATGCISVANGGVCAWDNTSSFCYMNIAGLEYSCFDDADNNANGLVDCNDPSCFSDKFCGGGEFEKKLLTDRNYVESLKQFGICRDSSSGIQCNKEQAMKLDAAREMGDKPGAPVMLKEDGDSSNEPAAGTYITNSWLNIIGFGFKDMGKSIGMGMMLLNGSASAVCGGSPNGTGLYYYYIDTDANPSTGCWENISAKNVSGIEFKLVYNVSMLANGTNFVEKRQAYRCLVSNTTSFGLFPAKLSTPVNPFQASSAPICTFGASIIVVPLADIGNPSTSMVYHIATTDNVTVVGMANDTIYNATYTPGAVEFIPPDCDRNPMACGTAFAKMGGGRFLPVEDCFIGSPDEDQDGTANCADTDCIQAPWCGANRASLIANDKSAPRIVSSNIEAFDTFAMFRQSTSEPSNISIDFFHNVSSCLVVRANLTETLSGSIFEFDRYKPWHSLSFDNFSMSDTNLTPLKPNVTYYYRTKNCDVSGNCAVSACLNFTTKPSGDKNFNFGLLFDSRGSSSLSGLNLTYWNGSEYAHFSVRNISFISNTTMRFFNNNASFNGSIKPWNIEFEGVDIAKATSINLTDMIQVTELNETNLVGGGFHARQLIGINGTKWQEMAQVLGIDSVLINISQVGNRIIKCDINGSGCMDVTSNVTIVAKGSNYTTIRIPTYGLGGFSSYGVNNSGVQLQSDRNSYQCFPSCTIYWNVTNYQSNFSQLFNVTISVNDTSAKTLYNISYLNLSNISTGNQWVPLPALNESNITNYNFVIVNASNLNSTVHQFKIDVNITVPIAERVTFNFTVTNNSGFVSSWNDIVWLDTINITNADNMLTTEQAPNISIVLLSLNQSNQSCSFRINGSVVTNSTVVNNTLSGFYVNRNLSNGTYTYNFTCSNTLTGDIGNSSIRTLRVIDVKPPMFNQTPSASVSSTSTTVTWTNDERTNTTLSHGTAAATFGTNTTETGFGTGHSVSLSSLTASTTYYYNVTSCDNVGNCNTTGPLSFTTSAASSSSSSSSSSGGGGGGTAAVNVEKASQKWAELPAGSTVMNVVKSSLAIRKIIMQTTTVASNVEVVVTKVNGTPSVGVSPGSTYQYLTIEASNIAGAGLKSASIEFNVERKWLTENNVQRDKVSLYRYSSDKWNELTTTITGDDTLNINYKAETPGFSTFAIAGKSETPAATPSNATANITSPTANETVVQQPANETTVAGEQPSLMPSLGSIKGVPLINIIAGAIVLIAILGVVGYFITRRKNSGSL